MSNLKLTKKELKREEAIKRALEIFSMNGIENTKVSDIAESINLTERTLFRYFKTKNELILDSALLFWKEKVKEITEYIKIHMDSSLKGIEQVEYILKLYSNLYFTSKKELIFCAEAEVYLNRIEKEILRKSKPVMNFENSLDPLAKAIQKGISDQTIKNNDKLKYLYLNTYDSLLGFLQKLALDVNSNEEEIKIRLDLFIESLVDSYKLK